MFGGFRIWRFLFSLLLIGLLVAGGVALYQFAFAQGYQAGALASGSTGGNGTLAQPGYPGYAPYWPVFAFPLFFPPFGLFLGFGFIFFLFFIVGGLFRFGGRRHWRDWDNRSGGQPGNPSGPNEPASKV